MLEAIGTSDFAMWVDESWGWPLALTIHAFGNAIVVGFMAIIALRLFGFFPGIPYSSLRSLIPYIWISIVFQAFSGFTLWMTKPGAYLGDYMFEVKFTLVIVASVVMLWGIAFLAILTAAIASTFVARAERERRLREAVEEEREEERVQARFDDLTARLERIEQQLSRLAGG